MTKKQKLINPIILIPLLFVIFIIQMETFSGARSHDVSIIYSAANVVSFKKSKRITPGEIRRVMHFSNSSKIKIKEYLERVSKYYALKLNEYTLNPKNLEEMRVILESNLMSNNPVIVIYQKKNGFHSAVVAGARYNPKGEIMMYGVNDPALKGRDFINKVTLKSLHWKAQIYQLFWFD